MSLHNISSPEAWDFVEIGLVKDLVEADRWLVDLEDRTILVFNVAGDFIAIEDVCSHDGNSLGVGELRGYEITCPRHGASFDIRNGKALSLPAVVDIPVYPIQVIDGVIYVGFRRLN
jgi:3-phenylpropionate/trans-cinnamate dioxygenase ferredoxin component